MPRDEDIDAGYTGPGGGGYSGNPRGDPSGFSGGGWNSVTEGGGDDRNKYRRRTSGRKKLPSEYADFKLADGRTLREVMGDKFFGAAGAGGNGKFMSKGVRERLAKGNAAIAGRTPRTLVSGGLAAFKAKYPNARFGPGASRQAAAEARRAEQQARRDERRARMEARRAAHPGENFNFGGEL
jgi:hypothetical protein